MKKRAKFYLLGGCCLLLLSFNSLAQTPNWPQFRGVNSSGIGNDAQTPPVQFGLETGMLWGTSLSKGCSSPCIWGDHMYLTACDEKGKCLIMYSVDRKTGEIAWKKELFVDTLEAVHQTSYVANATPATDGERVVFYFSSYGLQCLDPQGELIWEKRMPIPESRHGMGTSPVISGDLVILNCFGYSEAPSLLALNKFSGEQVWRHDWEVKENQWIDSYSTPVMYKNQVIIFRSADVSSYELNTGEQIWAFQVNMGDAICTPVVGEEMAYVTVYSTLGNKSTRAQFPSFESLASDRDKNQDGLIDKEELGGFEFNIYPEKGEKVSSPVQAKNFFWYYDTGGDGFIDSMEWNTVLRFCKSSYMRQGIKAIRLDGTGDVTLSKLV